jgi:hypothetical protein
LLKKSFNRNFKIRNFDIVGDIFLKNNILSKNDSNFLINNIF